MHANDALPFEVRAGTEVVLQPGEWKDSTGPLRVRIERVRWDLSALYSGAEVWIEGHRLDDQRWPVEPVQALVSVPALRRELP